MRMAFFIASTAWLMKGFPPVGTFCKPKTSLATVNIVCSTISSEARAGKVSRAACILVWNSGARLSISEKLSCSRQTMGLC